MGVSGALQVRLKAPRSDNNKAVVQSWCLPAYAVTMRSPSIMMVTGEDLVLIRQRIADALAIQDGDVVDFDLVEWGETIRLPVKIRDNIASDVLIHDWFTLGLVKNFSADSSGETLTLHSGKIITLPRQEMFAGMKVSKFSGTAKLCFDGASRNNPKGPTGYGFRITLVDEKQSELVRGYGYGGMNRTSNEMEYYGLIEGFVWASRLDLKDLIVCGDSELIINQMNGSYQVNDPKLQALVQKAKHLVNFMSERQTNVSFRHVPREQNTSADLLANLGIDTMENMVVCNWGNVNRKMKVTPW
ncbi:unnamed protein product [Cylindrotheca closterium]|uniref:RNase H type-1 domain-containing protein n=1 Tax=Cylindrotheca closterium TaxID=2856 RepID=A0AAD2G6F7_9STRA|nr:unnamed protein product [Cylindrotheca closterium]